MSRYEFNGQAFELRYPAVMGILNLTPDSFSDGGDFFDTEAAIEHALSMVEAGAQIIDLGGESTRPGSDPVSDEEELARVIPVLEKLPTDQFVLSIDTTKPTVARAALQAGAHASTTYRAETPNYSTWPRATGPALFSCMLKALRRTCRTSRSMTTSWRKSGLFLISKKMN